MAIITFEFTRDGKTHRMRGPASRSDERMGWDLSPRGFVPDRMVVDVVRENTMRVHCFYCWNDATKFHEVEVCDDHAPAGAPDLMHRYKPGMHDDPTQTAEREGRN